MTTNKLTQEEVLEAAQQDEYIGFCIACGEQAENVEPDGRYYRCDICGAHQVFGAEEILIRVTFLPKEKSVFELIEGLTPVDATALAEFKRAMTEEVIPEIVRIVEERRSLAAKSRHWQIKC